ncbi:MAG: hypothetical protein ACPLYF_02990 [Fervidobacterium sp.]
MGEYIIFKQDDGKMMKIMSSGYDEESLLQGLIKEYSTLLPSISSGRIFALVDEYPTDVGSIDVLCVDEAGRIYIVETKLQKNSDRRTVIAQILDYAARMGKETFDDFRSKIKERTTKSLDEILGDFEESAEFLDRIRQSLVEKNFVLVVAMDNIEPRLKDTIIFLNQDMEMDIFGLELNRYRVEGKGEVFVPVVIPPPEMPRPSKPRKPPTTFDEVIKNYREKGLEDEILKIKEIFERMEKQEEIVQVKTLPTFMVLDIGEKQIQVAINRDPERDHGVWVYNPSLYDKVYELGETLGLQVKKGTSPNFLKVIQFNGIEGIKSISEKMQNLIEGLIKIIKGA